MKALANLFLSLLLVTLFLFSSACDGGDDDDDANADDDASPDDDGAADDDGAGDDDASDDDAGDCWDEDEDGYNDVICGGEDCNDSDPSIHPEAEEICIDDIDQDCDGTADDGCTYWKVETVDISGNVGQHASLALSPDGVFGIAYYDAAAKDLKYAQGTFGDWEITTPVAEGDVGQYASLGFDSTGKPGIAYYKPGSGGGAFYTDRSGSVWKVEKISVGVLQGKYIDLAMGTDDQPRVIYDDYFLSGFRYATRTNSGWQREEIDTVGFLFNRALALDSYNRPTVAAQVRRLIDYDPDIYEYHLVVFLSDGGPWIEGELDARPHVADYVDVASTPDGLPWISYTEDHTNKDLYCAWWDGVDWWQVTLDEEFSTGQYNSIARRDDGLVGVSYYNESLATLMYAEFDGVQVKVETVDNQGEVGQHTSLVFDQSGNPAIAYYDFSSKTLKFAERVQIEEVE